MHWLVPFIVVEIQPSKAVRLAQLDGMLWPEWVNGARVKPYMSQNGVKDYFSSPKEHV
jgi:hypothetical protein